MKRKPEQYRKRAAFLNRLAQEAPNQALRDSYVRLALDWEELAEKAERARGSEDRQKDEADDDNPA